MCNNIFWGLGSCEMSYFIFWSGPIICLWGELNAIYDGSWLRWLSLGLCKTEASHIRGLSMAEAYLPAAYLPHTILTHLYICTACTFVQKHRHPPFQRFIWGWVQCRGEETESLLWSCYFEFWLNKVGSGEKDSQQVEALFTLLHHMSVLSEAESSV